MGMTMKEDPFCAMVGRFVGSGSWSSGYGCFGGSAALVKPVNGRKPVARFMMKTCPFTSSRRTGLVATLTGTDGRPLRSLTVHILPWLDDTTKGLSSRYARSASSTAVIVGEEENIESGTTAKPKA